MFYCQECAVKNNWPHGQWVINQSRGKCEICGTSGVCFDVPSKYLPAPKIVVPELLPCPFCGGNAHFQDGKEDQGQYWIPSDYIQCNGCNVSTPHLTDYQEADKVKRKSYPSPGLESESLKMIPQAILNASRNFQILGGVDIPQVLELLRAGKTEFLVSTSHFPIAEVWLDHVALTPFLESCDCYKCGRKGHMFLIRRNYNDKKTKWGNWHLTLFTETGQMMTCDHIVPKVYGGTDDPSNLGTLCRRCNTKKADKPVDRFMKGCKNGQAL